MSYPSVAGIIPFGRRPFAAPPFSGVLGSGSPDPAYATVTIAGPSAALPA